MFHYEYFKRAEKECLANSFGKYQNDVLSLLITTI